MTIKDDAEAFKSKMFAKIPPQMEEKSEFQIRKESLEEALEEVNKIISGVDKGNRDPRIINTYKFHKQSIEQELETLLKNHKG